MTPHQRYVLGVDGGNSKTAVALVDLDGDVVGTTVGGGSDIYTSASTEAAVGVIAALVSEALTAAGIGAGQLTAAVFSLAGADWPEDIALLEASITDQLELPATTLVMNDAIGGVWSATEAGEGVAVVVGTFNAVGARHRDGTVFHCGFWPDRTGGFDLGTEALKAVYRDGLGLGPSTALTPHALDLFEASDPMDLMHRFNRREGARPPWDVQQLTPLLLDCADAGDQVALAIVREAGEWLGNQARVSAERVGLDPWGATVVLTGGVLRHPSSVLPDAIAERLPGAKPVLSHAPPVVGALRCGLASLGLSSVVDPSALTHLVGAR